MPLQSAATISATGTQQTVGHQSRTVAGSADEDADSVNDIVVYSRVNCEGMDGPGLFFLNTKYGDVITQYLRGVWPQSPLLEIAADPMAPLGQPCKVCPRWQIVMPRYNVPG